MMRSRSILVFFALLAAIPAVAQVTSSDALNVSANNVGNFTFTITQTAYNFGTISSIGAANAGGDETLTSTTTSTSATYTSGGTFINWTASSAPPRTVRFHNSSSSGAHTINWGTINSLELQIPTTGLPSGISCGWKAIGTTGDDAGSGCGAGQLYHSLASVGRGSNDKTGYLQLRVTVNDTDNTGSNTWVVQVTATGS